MDNFTDCAAAAQIKKGVYREIDDKQCAPKAYRLRYFSEEGQLLWSRVVEGQGQVEASQISYDGSLIVLLMNWPATDRVYPGRRPDTGLAYWLVAYNDKGVRLLEFPRHKGVCDFSSLMDFWLSKTGKYMMTTCGQGFNKTPSYFFQPKSRLFWNAGKAYTVDYKTKQLTAGDNEEWTDEDEEFGRVDLMVSRYESGTFYQEPAHLVLSGGDWRPLSGLK